MNDVVESAMGLASGAPVRIALSLGVLVVVWVLRRLLLRVVNRQIQDPATRYQWSKSSVYVAFVVVLALLGQIWLEAIRNLGTFLGLLSAGLAIALRDLVTNLAGWAFILLRHPFTVGDRVQVGEHRGDVVDIRIFQFTLLEIGNWVAADQSTGRIIHVPNSAVFTEALANYTAGFPFIWHEVAVLVTFESNWRKAKGILQGILDEHALSASSEAESAVRRASRTFLILYRTLTPKVYTDVEDSGVRLTLRFICPVRKRRGLSERLWEAILDAFHQEEDIDFAYPTRRLFMNPVEGKTGARADLPEPIRSGQPADGGAPVERAEREAPVDA